MTEQDEELATKTYNEVQEGTVFTPPNESEWRVYWSKTLGIDLWAENKLRLVKSGN